jgi:hypothetical protein
MSQKKKMGVCGEEMIMRFQDTGGKNVAEFACAGYMKASPIEVSLIQSSTLRVNHLHPAIPIGVRMDTTAK